MSNIPAYRDELDRECHVYTSYLMDWQPDRYVLDKYRDGHNVSEVFRNAPYKMMDMILVSISSRHPFLARFADVYTRVFYRSAVIRKKLILLLSILESSSASHSYYDIPDRHQKTGLFLRMLAKGLRFVFLLGLSVLLLMPIHAVCAMSSILYKREY